MLPIILEDRIKNPPHVFNHHGAGANLVHNPDERRKQVALVQGAKLFSSDRERRAGQAGRNDICTRKTPRVKCAQILLDYVPSRTVQAKG
jgi:hypothetical protein